MDPNVFSGLAAATTGERDAATQAVIELGTELSSKLLLWEQLSPSDRARRLWTFMGVHIKRAEEMVRQPRSFDIEHQGTLRSLLEILAFKHGVLVARELPADLLDKPVSIAMRDATLLAALDEGCAQAGCRGSQRARGELMIHDEREPVYPAAYVGPMRVRLVELRSTRGTDFTSTSVTAQARLRIEWEWPVGPVGPLAIQIHDVDRRYEVEAVTSVVHIGMVAEQLVDVPPASPLALAGTVSAMFEGAYEEVRLAIGDAVTVHGLAVTAIAHDGGPHLQIETVDPARLTGTVDLGLSPMILGIASNGEEGIPQINRDPAGGVRNPAGGVRNPVRDPAGGVRDPAGGVRMATDKPGSERWGLRFRDGFGQAAELRLRIAAAPVRGKLDFALPHVSLP